MIIKNLLEMDMGQAVDWLIENQDNYELVEIKEPCRFCVDGNASMMAKFCPKCGRKLHG